MLVATRKARPGSAGRKNADITALLVRSYLTASEDDLAHFNRDAHGWISSRSMLWVCKDCCCVAVMNVISMNGIGWFTADSQC